MADESVSSPADRVRSLVRIRQMRDFAAEPVTAAELDAIADVARWSGSATNSQPWRFIAIRDVTTLRRIAEAAMPQARALLTATAAIAIVLPEDAGHAVPHAYDEGRAAERILDAASMLGLGAGVGWIMPEVRGAVGGILALPEGRFVRTVVALGHPSEAALRPKSAPGAARLPREQVVFEERWPQGRS